MSTHCQPPAFLDLKGTRGTPTGIILVTRRRGPPLELQQWFPISTPPVSRPTFRNEVTTRLRGVVTLMRRSRSSS